MCINVSIVTVCLNAENTIEKTINSILEQEYKSIEYIVVDGASEDNTYNIICSYNDLFKKKGIHFKSISEPDSGIYNAMNKALSMCNGEWVYFLNAGDSFADNSVLTNVFYNKELKDVSVIYGNVINSNKYGIRKSYPKPLKEIRRTMPFCHQGCFIRTKPAQMLRFNENYKFAADYDMFLRAYKNNYKFLKTDVFISVYDVEGLSGNIKNRLNVLSEFFRIKKENECQPNRLMFLFKASFAKLRIIINRNKLISNAFYKMKYREKK